MITGVIIYFVILATAYPVAELLARLCEDEIVKDRKYFLYFSYFLIIVSAGFAIVYFNAAILLSLVYIFLLMVFLIIKGKKSKRNSKK